MGRGEAGVDLESRLKGSMGMKPPLGAPAAQAEAAGEGVTMDLDWIRLGRLWFDTWLLRTCWWELLPGRSECEWETGKL